MTQHTSFWDGNHPMQGIYTELCRLIPSEGPVNRPYKNKHLESLRKATNLYCDMFEHGGTHKRLAIRKVFGVGRADYVRGVDTDWTRLMADMDKTIVSKIQAAYKEQFETADKVIVKEFT